MTEATLPPQNEDISLKEYLEVRLKSLEELRAAEARALIIQASEYERRLTALNGEQSRIAANQSSSVSREIWDRSQLEDRQWKARVEAVMAAALPRTEFQTYKETTDRALQLKAGQTQGVGLTAGVVVQVILSVAGIGSIVGVVALLMKHG